MAVMSAVAQAKPAGTIAPAAASRSTAAPAKQFATRRVAASLASVSDRL